MAISAARSGAASVTEIIGRALPVTASLVIGGAVVWVLLAFPIGVLLALRPRLLLDKGLMILLLIGVSAHPVWLGLTLSYLLGFRLDLFPTRGDGVRRAAPPAAASSGARQGVGDVASHRAQTCS
jgi:ABC-type dipeptide/oligopeptide/nickel transport system permease component